MLPVPMPTSETWIPVLPSVTMSVGLLGRAIDRGPCARRAMGNGGGHGHRGGRGSGGLGHEISAIQGGCHDVVLPGLEVTINALSGLTTRCTTASIRPEMKRPTPIGAIADSNPLRTVLP